MDSSRPTPRTLTWRQDISRRIIVLGHRYLAGDSPIRQNTGTALLLLLVQISLAVFLLRSGGATLPGGGWVLVVAAIAATHLLVSIRIESSRGGLRSQKKNLRKLLTTAILDDFVGSESTTIDLSDSERRLIRERLLNVIASNVASFFYDFSRTRIDAVLLTLKTVTIDGLDKPCLCVEARDDPSRERRNILDVENYIAFKTIRIDCLHSTGNIGWEYPHLTDKPYKSVLSLPVRLKSRVVAAVNINSSRRFHFQGREALFEANLAPYLSLLALTFRE